MTQNADYAGNLILIRGACLWLLVTLFLAWCIVAIFNDIGIVKIIFSGNYKRLVQGHIDLLIMTSLIMGLFATKVILPWHVRWAMVIGAFTNSSLFLLFAIFPSLDPASAQFIPNGTGTTSFNIYMYASLLVTSYGFGKAAVIVLKWSFKTA